MRVTIGDQPYVVRFETEFYDPPVLEVQPTKRKGHYVKARTRCTITRSETFLIEKIVSRGSAACSVKDVFDLHAGRRLALYRALDPATFTEAERVVFWDAFRKTLPKAKPSYASLRKALHTAERRINELEVRTHV